MELELIEYIFFPGRSRRRALGKNAELTVRERAGMSIVK